MYRPFFFFFFFHPFPKRKPQNIKNHLRSTLGVSFKPPTYSRARPAMANGAAPPPPTQPLEHAASTAAATALAVNAVRLQAIIDRLKAHFRSTGSAPLPQAELAQLLYALARGIDYALSSNHVPPITDAIPALLRKVYEQRNNPSLQSPLMVLAISCKNACNNKWFESTDSADILKMSNELSSSFCTSLGQIANDSTTLDIISIIMPRYYPKLRFGRLIASLEAKVGYDILVVDFFIQRNLPQNETINLIVVQKENLDSSLCITSPPHVSFLVNGKGVDKRTNVSMETGPQFPTDITKMLKYGTNIIQAVGYFNANYIVAVAYISNLTSSDARKLDDYAQPVTADHPPDSDILEGPSRVSLNCPISFRRIKTPIKGRLCKHYQCFDYDNFMEMNSRKPTWRCPCCNTPSNSIDLRVDQKMVKILREAGDDIVDVFIFTDGSWNAVSTHDEKSDGHTDEVVRQNGNITETNAPSDVVDLITENDDGDLLMSNTEPLPGKNTNLGGKPTSSSEDTKPLVNDQDLSVTDFLSALPVTNTPAQDDAWTSGDPCSNSFGTLESILPQDVLHPVITDAVSLSLETSRSAITTQPVSQGRQHLNNVQLQPLRDPLPQPEVAHSPIPRYVRREPVAIQALPVPPHDPGSSRRVPPTVFNCPPPIPLSSSTSSTCQALQVTNSDGGVTATNSGVGQLPRTSDAASLWQLHSTPQDMHNTTNQLLGRVVGVAAPHSIGTRPPLPGQARGAGAPISLMLHERQNLNQMMSQAVQAYAMDTALSPDPRSPPFLAQRNQVMRSQAGSPAALPQAPRMQASTLPNVDRSTLQSGGSDGLLELPMEQNWRPTGRMRGSLTGSAYSAALDRYLASPSQQDSQSRPPSSDGRRPLS